MRYQTIYLASLATAIMLCSSPMAYAGADESKVLRDSNGNIIRSVLHHTCVRSKWKNDSDPCAPEPKVAEVAPPSPPQPEAQTHTTLSSADRTVYFDFDSSALLPDAQNKLDSLAETLKKASDIKSAKIVGYADPKGSSSYNEQLSHKRAEIVKTYLAQQGYMNTEVADVRGVGESAATTACSADLPRDERISCMSPDRRVEVEVQYTNTQRYGWAY